MNKNIQGIGGVKTLAGIISYVGKRTYEGYEPPKAAYELYAKAPNQRATVQHTPNGDQHHDIRWTDRVGSRAGHGS